MLDVHDGEARRHRACRLFPKNGDEVLSQLSVSPVKGPELPRGLQNGISCTPVYTQYDPDYGRFYAAALRDVEAAKRTREYALDMENHPNWFDASYLPWLSYDSLNLELPDGYLYFAPIVNWGKYREENGRLLMPVTIRLNHAIADGYLVANVFRLLEREIGAFAGL